MNTDTELAELINLIYSRWTGTEVAGAIAEYRRRIEAETELLKIDQDIELLVQKRQNLSK